MANGMIEKLQEKYPGQEEFIQAAREVYQSIEPVIDAHKKFADLKILERMLEPERTVSFRVTWMDDNNEVQINRGWRVQMNSAIGPYKGGLRFSPSVNSGTFKFLAFEQMFKNALTGLPLGAAKGGSDFDPKGKSDTEVMRFCQAFITELQRHIGYRIDIPAGDIGVGTREIGYMFGTYKKIKNKFTGMLTGKGIMWGGSLIRMEATGFGLIYFAQNMLETKNENLNDKICLVSGSGNVAQHAIEKIIEQGGKPVTVSDSSGHIYDKDGINEEKLNYIKKIKNEKRGRIREYAEKYTKAEYYEKDKDANSNPLWDHKADCAFPCATQNEINEADAKNLIHNGIRLIGEGSNMPLTAKAVKVILDHNDNLLYAPAKASNAGGVAVSGLEMTQNRMGTYWGKDKLDKKLQKIMKDIHEKCLAASRKYESKNIYLDGANIAGFLKVARAMAAQGIV